MIPFIKEYLWQNWPGLDLGVKPSDLLFIKFADRGIRSQEVGILSFLVKGKFPGGERPLLILRFPRYPKNSGARQSLEKEHQNLINIRQGVGFQEIPNPLIWLEINGARVLGQSFLPGQPLSQGMIADDLLKTYIDKFGQAFSWLVSFQKAFGRGGAMRLNQIVEQVISSCPGHGQASYYAKIWAEVNKLGNPEVPLYVQHGDFHAENIFVLGDKVSGVIDWEDFAETTLPAFDLFHFIKTYFEAVLAYWGAQRAVGQLTSFPTDQNVLGIIKATIGNYFRQLGLSADLLPVLLPLYLIQSTALAAAPRKMALSAVKRLETLLGLGPMSIEALLLYLTVFPLGDIYKESLAKNDQETARICKNRVLEIQKIAAA